MSLNFVAGTTAKAFYPDYNTKASLLAKGDTQRQVVDSGSAHDSHDVGPDFWTHYYVDDPSYGCDDDAADLGFGSDYFSVYAGPGLDYGLDYDYRGKQPFSLLKNQPTSFGF